MSDRMQNLYEGVSLLVQLANENYPTEKTAGIGSSVSRGARRYWELMTGANVPAKDVFKETKKAKDSMPGQEEFLDEIRKTLLSERNKVRATRAGTALGLGAGGYGVGAALKGQQGDLVDAVEKSASLISKVQRGARRWKEGITGEMLDGATVRSTNRALRDSLEDLKDDPAMSAVYRQLDDRVKDQDKELRHVIATRLGTAATLGGAGVGVAYGKSRGKQK